MKKKYIKTLSIALLLAVPVLCCTDAMAWEYYRFPWANAGHYAAYDNTNGYVKGGPQFGEYGHPVYDSAITAGAPNPIWNQTEVFGSATWSWYDCLEGNYHWNLAITNPSNLDCTFTSNRLILRVFKMDGTKATDGVSGTEIENVGAYLDNKKLINTNPSNTSIQWNANADEFYLAIPAGQTLIVSSRDIFNAAYFGANASRFGQIHVSLDLVSESIDFKMVMNGELDAWVRTEGSSTDAGVDVDGKAPLLEEHQWNTVQYTPLWSGNRVSGDEHMFLPYFYTKCDKTNEKAGFATAIYLRGQPVQKTYTLSIFDEDGALYNDTSYTITLDPYKTYYFLVSQYLPASTTEAKGTISITGEQPAALAVHFRIAFEDDANAGTLRYTSTHAVPFKFLGAASAASN